MWHVYLYFLHQYFYQYFWSEWTWCQKIVEEIPTGGHVLLFSKFQKTKSQPRWSVSWATSLYWRDSVRTAFWRSGFAVGRHSGCQEDSVQCCVKTGIFLHIKLLWNNEIQSQSYQTGPEFAFTTMFNELDECWTFK